MNIAELWHALQNGAEHSKLEVKEIMSHKIGEAIHSTMSAFSNSKGGHILLGIKEIKNSNTRHYLIKGIHDVDEIMQQAAGIAKTEFNTPLNIEVNHQKIEDKFVIGIFIPEAPSPQKPIFVKKQGIPQGAFKRVGSANQMLTDNDIERFYKERRDNVYDKEICKNATIESFNPKAIEQYRMLREKVDPTAVELSYDDTELLLALGCLESEDKTIKPTVAGILMFGTQSALRRLFPLASRADYIRISGTKWIENPEQRFETTLDLRDNLLSVLPRLEAAILDDLPKKFNLPEGKLQREDIPLLPNQVIREALANALMHRDYSVHGTIQIRRYADRIEISNPGYSLANIKDNERPITKTRNPNIAGIFHEIKYAENKGSGIKTMKMSMERAGLRTPEFNSDPDSNIFEITLSFHHFLNEETLHWLSPFNRKHKLNDYEIRALVYMREHRHITNEQLRIIAGCNLTQSNKALQKLRKQGLCKQNGKSRNTYYEATEMLTASQQNPISNSQKPISNPISNSQKPISNFVKNALSYTENSLKLKNKSEIINQLLEVCNTRPHQAKELAKLFDKELTHFTQAYLKPLIKETKLEYLYPENPRHRNQAYMTKESK